MVEGARLESVYRGNSIEGSNPSLSAIRINDLAPNGEHFGFTLEAAMRSGSRAKASGRTLIATSRFSFVSRAR